MSPDQQPLQPSLQQWQEALGRQRLTEEELEHARRRDDYGTYYRLLALLDELRTAADLLLAEAVRVGCLQREHFTRAALAHDTD